MNITRVSNPARPQAQQPASRGGSAAPTRFADKPVVRTISPITEYNNDTGVLDVKTDSPWGNEQATQPEPQEQTKSSEDRQAKWKEQQTTKKLDREAQRATKAATQQALAKDLLYKGDLVGAAKALNMTPSDLALYVDNARLSIPNKTEELTPEQKREKDELEFRQQRMQFEEQQNQFKYKVIADNYIRDKIQPALQDKEAFEIIHKVGVKQIENYMYEYMNKHFNETGEELSAKDVAETIEQQLLDARTKSLEDAKQTKKLSKYFTQQEIEELAKDEQSYYTNEEKSEWKEPSIKERSIQPLVSRFPTIEDEEEEETSQKKPISAVRRSNNASKVPFAFLSKEERMAQIKEDMKAGR